MNLIQFLFPLMFSALLLSAPAKPGKLENAIVAKSTRWICYKQAFSGLSNKELATLTKNKIETRKVTFADESMHSICMDARSYSYACISHEYHKPQHKIYSIDSPDIFLEDIEIPEAITSIVSIQMKEKEPIQYLSDEFSRCTCRDEK